MTSPRISSCRISLLHQNIFYCWVFLDPVKVTKARYGRPTGTISTVLPNISNIAHASGVLVCWAILGRSSSRLMVLVEAFIEMKICKLSKN
jgi:hypothetical protein